MPHPIQRYSPLKPQLAMLDPRSKFGRGVLGAWLINDDGGLRAIGAGTTENYPEYIRDAGPYSCHVSEIFGSEDEMRTVDSPWGQGVYFPTGNYGEFRNDWGKFWEGLTAVSTFAIVRPRTASQLTNILNAGLSGITTSKLEFHFTSGNQLWYKTRAGTEGIQGQYSVKTFAANQWHVVGGTARVVNGGGVYRLYSDGVEIAGQGAAPNHSFSSYSNQYGGWECHLGGLDYTLTTWANIDIVFCMHWGWELTPEDMLSLYNDPYQAFYRPEYSRYGNVLAGDGAVPFYIVDLPSIRAGETRVGGAKRMIVEAVSADSAKAGANSLWAADVDWNQADVTELTTGQKYEGSKWRVRVSGAAPGSKDVIDVEYTAQTDDTIADVGSGIAALINAYGVAVNYASYSSLVLTVAGAADNLGDRTVRIDITPAGAREPMALVADEPVKTITHQGVQGAALTIELVDTGLPRALAVC